MIDISKLETVCPRCKGEKWVSNPEWQEYWRKWNEIDKKIKHEHPEMTLPERDKLIEKTLREMGIVEPEGSEEYLCPECEGRGMILTKEGTELIGFLRKYLVNDIEDFINEMRCRNYGTDTN